MQPCIAHPLASLLSRSLRGQTGPQVGADAETYGRSWNPLFETLQNWEEILRACEQAITDASDNVSAAPIDGPSAIKESSAAGCPLMHSWEQVRKTVRVRRTRLSRFSLVLLYHHEVVVKQNADGWLDPALGDCGIQHSGLSNPIYELARIERCTSSPVSDRASASAMERIDE